MKLDFTALKKLQSHPVYFSLRHHTQLLTCIALGICCLVIYQLNGTMVVPSNDNIPNTLLAFNWLENHTLHFDAFRDSYFYRIAGESPYFFVEAPNGHLTSRYPIGTAIVTFPFYCLFFVYLKLMAGWTALSSGLPGTLDLTNPDFNSYRKLFGKLAATLCCTLSVILFYLSIRLKFSQPIALLTTFIYGFATSTWVICSQDLRQHTASNVLLTAVLLCLLKAERSPPQPKKKLLLVAGLLCGLLPTVRITSAIFTLTIWGFVWIIHRPVRWWFTGGLLSASLGLLWNVYYFGWANAITGGYIEQLQNRPFSYQFSLQHFIEAFGGLLISPGDGFFVFSPVLLFAIPGFLYLWKHRFGRDETVLLSLVFASLLLLLHYGFYSSWRGGSGSYGSRYTTDTLPVVCFLIAYALVPLTRQFVLRPPPGQSLMRPTLNLAFASFLACLLMSTTIQAVGAFSRTDWGISPLPLLVDSQRVWSFRDSQIERHTRNLVARLTKPIANRQTYVQGLNGQLDHLMAMTLERQPDPDLTVAIAKDKQIVSATLTNQGPSPWYGYQTGMLGVGETRIRIRFLDAQGHEDSYSRNFLYIDGTPQPGEQTQAIGQVTFPFYPGNYRMVFELTASGLRPRLNPRSPIYELALQVNPEA